MEISMQDYEKYCTEFPLIKQHDFSKYHKVARQTIWRKIMNGKLDFVKLEFLSLKTGEKNIIRYIVYNNRAKNISFRRPNWGLTDEELNKK